MITGHVARRDIRQDPSRSGDGLAIAGLVLGYIGIATLVIVLVLVAADTGSRQSSPLSNNCITNNFGAELCGQDAVDYCQSLDENQAQIEEDAEEAAADARELNRDAKRDASRYGGSAEDYGYDPDAPEDAVESVDDGFTRKSQEVCQQVYEAEGL